MAILIPENEQQKFRISDSLEVEELPIFEMDVYYGTITTVKMRRDEAYGYLLKVIMLKNGYVIISINYDSFL